MRDDVCLGDAAWDERRTGETYKNDREPYLNRVLFCLGVRSLPAPIYLAPLPHGTGLGYVADDR